ncbi:MAG: discoidin domain-containing protein [Planctomycetes bacterium]|nr:discoidin domain-containing protein [Planctomycetota bacterium]
MRRRWGRVVGLGCLLLVGTMWGAQPDEVRTILGRCVIANTQPHLATAVSAFETMNYFPALGNGNLMVTLSGTPERLTFHLGKTDFWRDKCRDKKWWQSGNVLTGYVNVLVPDLAGATFQQSVDLYHAEASTVLTKAEKVVALRSVVPHEAENLLVNTIENRGKQPIALRIETCTDQFVNRAEPFEVAAGVDEKDPALAWTTRKTHVPPDYNDFGSCEFRMWVAVATRLFDAQCQTQIDNTVNYDANDLQVKSAQLFTLEPGRSLLVVTKVHSTGIPVTMNPADPRPAALEAVKALSREQVQEQIQKHRAWWDGYWHKSYVRLDAEPIIERTYYGALYVLGCSTRVGKYPVGCNGFPVNDEVPWGGDYHWNYNNEALYYGAYSANRIEQTEPYDRTVLEANTFGRMQAKAGKVAGTLFFMATAPGHLNEAIILGQKTHAVEASLNLIERYYSTYDLEWAKSMYPFFKDVAAYWDQDLEKNKETRPNGTPRYVIVDSKPMEGPTVDTYNGITGLAFLRRFYRGMIDLTQDLTASGYNTGYTEKDIARWKDFLANLAEYPMSYAYGRRVFAWGEVTLNPLLTEQDWVLYPVFPGEQVGLASNPWLLAVARNTLAIKPQYYVEWLNNPPQIFSIAARLAGHPPEVIERCRTYFSKVGVNNFRSGGGNVEGAGVAEGINAMLLQSHEGFLRLFPCWHHPEAKFATIRAAGAFLVSAEARGGVCQPITIMSEKGRPCSVLNPWPGKTVVVQDTAGGAVDVKVEDRSCGQICTFATQAGKTYTVAPKDGLPAPAPYWNAALYKPVTASSNFKPEKEKDNWDAAKLTDGVRINTRVGHRGWTSALFDDAKHTEWVQVDLGQAVSAKAIQLWPLDHGDAWQNTHCSEPFVESTEIDQSYDGFPLDFHILVSQDGKAWDELVKMTSFRRPAVGPDDSDRKTKDVTGPERFDFEPRSFRYVKVESTRLRKTRYFGKYAMQLAEIEVVRGEPAPASAPASAPAPAAAPTTKPK